MKIIEIYQNKDYTIALDSKGKAWVFGVVMKKEDELQSYESKWKYEWVKIKETK